MTSKAVLSNVEATSRIWLLTTWNVASTEMRQAQTVKHTIFKRLSTINEKYLTNNILIFITGWNDTILVILG